MKPSKLILLVLIVISSYSYAASFDCKQASSKIERAICSSHMLNILDEKLSSRYTILKQHLDGSELNTFVKEQRVWLKKRDKLCKNKEKSNIEKCLISMYWERIEYFDRNYKKLFTIPLKDELTDICTQIANNPEKFVKLHSIKDQSFDINNDGVIDEVETGTMGTMRMPFYSYVSPSGGKLRYATGQNSEWEDDYLYGLAHIKIKGHVFQLISIDDYFKKPAYMSYITPLDENYAVCKFLNNVIDTLVLNENVQNERDVCTAVQNKSNINYIKLTKHTELKREDILENPREHSLGKEGLVDYDNDGTPNEVIMIYYDSGAGRGCSTQHFEEIVSKEKTVKISKSRDLLAKTQRRVCGSRVQLFEYQNKIYIEEVGGNSHIVQKIENGKVDTICNRKRNITTKLIYVYE